MIGTGQIEVDLRGQPVPPRGTAFTVELGGRRVRAIVTGTRALPTPQGRTMGIIKMLATHVVSFEVP